jgi:hypothetical protein
VTVLEGILFAVFTVAIVAIGGTPDRVTCARGFYAEGVRPSGETTCRRAPRSDLDDSDETYGARVHCTGGADPIVIDHRTVGCTRRWSR